MDFDTIRVANSSATLNFSANLTTTTFTIPASLVTLDAASGRSNNARFVRVLPASDISSRVFINFGPTNTVSVTAANGVMLTPNEPTVFNVSGYSYFALIGVTTASVVSVVPIEV